MQNKETILKWLNNDLTEAELKEFSKTEDYTALVAVIERTKGFKKPEFNAEEALAEFNTMKKPKTKIVRLNPVKRWLAVASSVILLISLSLLFFDTNKVIRTDFAETISVELPDNSEVIVNAGSRIEYSDKKWEKERKVSLTGEAFFKVTGGNTFDVETDLGTVTVVGTQFNIRQRNGFFEVYCYEGKVKVTTQGKEIFLIRGQYLAFVNGELREVSTFSNASPDWLNNESNFNNVPFNLVLEELERQFGVKVNTDADMTQKNFTGGFSHASLESALESVTFPLNMKYEIVNDNTVKLYSNN